MMHIQVHSIGELERVLQLVLEGTMLGINNRDLQTFTVDLDNSKIILSSPAGQEVHAPVMQSELLTLAYGWLVRHGSIKSGW